MDPNNRARAIQQKGGKSPDRISLMLEHMQENRALRAYLKKNPGCDQEGAVHNFRARFQEYRDNWHKNPQTAFQEGLHGEALAKRGFVPLSVDLELSAMCDLACPFCYRQHIATPDKLMHADLMEAVIDQASVLGVPAMKFNWRGEPLLHPKLPQAVARAKDRGILDTIINTNAVTLTEEKSRALIEAGLDLMIYSFDGGAAKSYEKMRPGRFAANSFEEVYRNIRRFAEIKKELGVIFPMTKIQMLLTEETFAEQESFFALFNDCVDDVSVKAYTERGGSLNDLDPESRQRLQSFFSANSLPDTTPYWRDMDGNISVSMGRLPCEQPYQRVMVAYDGRAAMCCYDWGCEHPIGYLDERAIKNRDNDYRAARTASENRAAGYDLLKNLRLPRPFIEIPARLQTLSEIWHGETVNAVREKHVTGRLNEVEICRQCPFKETYNWQRIE